MTHSTDETRTLIDDPTVRLQTRQPVSAAPRDVEAENRIFETLDALEQLTQDLTGGEGYDNPEVAYPIPAGFLLSVVIPVYNERDTIRQILARVRSLPLPIEVIVVDDYSTDGTREILHELEGAENVTVLYKNYNEGKGAALRDGFAHAAGNVVIVQDADLEYDPRDIIRVIEPIVMGEADVVYGSRFLENGRTSNSSRMHQWGNRLLTAASNMTTGLHLTDMETCYKGFRREVLRGLTIRQNRFGFEPEVTAKIARRKYRVCELPISYHARDFDQGKKIGIRDGFNALWCIARYAMGD